MNKINIKGNWNELGSKLRHQFANLTDDDLLLTKGKEYKFWGDCSINEEKTKKNCAK